MTLIQIHCYIISQQQKLHVVISQVMTPYSTYLSKKNPKANEVYLEQATGIGKILNIVHSATESDN